MKYLINNHPELVEADVVLGGFSSFIAGKEAFPIQFDEKGSCRLQITIARLKTTISFFAVFAMSFDATSNNYVYFLAARCPRKPDSHLEWRSVIVIILSLVPRSRSMPRKRAEVRRNARQRLAHGILDMHWRL